MELGCDGGLGWLRLRESSVLTPKHPLPFPGIWFGFGVPWGFAADCRDPSREMLGWEGSAELEFRAGRSRCSPRSILRRESRCHLQMVPETGTKLGRAAAPGESGGKAGK